ncbi:MAG: YceI family protein [Stackebrandtia sp.]
MTETAAAPQLTGSYTLDPVHSRIGFVARHAMVTKVHGNFSEFEGTGTVDAAEPSKSSARLTIKTASVDTGNSQRDDHLRTNDFLDAPNHPRITFVSTGVERTGDVTYRLGGDLTIKGVTKPIVVELEYTGHAVDPYGNERIGFEGKASLNRRDFGVDFNAVLDAGGVLVSDNINLEFDVSAIKDQN